MHSSFSRHSGLDILVEGLQDNLHSVSQAVNGGQGDEDEDVCAGSC